MIVRFMLMLWHLLSSSLFGATVKPRIHVSCERNGFFKMVLRKVRFSLILVSRVNVHSQNFQNQAMLTRSVTSVRVSILQIGQVYQDCVALQYN